MPLKAVVFDFDGTLATLNVDFVEMRREIIALLARYEVPCGSLENLFALEMVDAGSRALGVKDPGQGRRFMDEALQLIHDIEMKGARKGSLLEGIEDMLSLLKRKGIKTAIVTRNCIDAVRCIYPGVHESFNAIISREFTPRVKPHPDHLRIALEQMGVLPHHTAMVGDHPMDIMAGKKAGSFTVGVLTGHSGADALGGAGADLVIPDAVSITRHIEFPGNTSPRDTNLPC